MKQHGYAVVKTAIGYIFTDTIRLTAGLAISAFNKSVGEGSLALQFNNRTDVHVADVYITTEEIK